MSRGLPYFKCYPQDFLHGMRDMSRGEVADYVRLLLIMYDNDAPVAFKPDKLKHLLGCFHAATCEKRIRRLVQIGKISIDANGVLHNGRVDRELRIRKDPAEIDPSSLQRSTHDLFEKPNASMRARARVRIQKPDNNLVTLAPYVQAGAKYSNGAAAAADGSPGFEGRSPQPPIASARAPPPDKPFPPPSKLMERVYGKTSKPDPKPGNGTQRGRNRGNSRKTAAPGRAGENHKGAAEGSEAEKPDRN